MLKIESRSIFWRGLAGVFGRLSRESRGMLRDTSGEVIAINVHKVLAGTVDNERVKDPHLRLC